MTYIDCLALSNSIAGEWHRVVIFRALPSPHVQIPLSNHVDLFHGNPVYNSTSLLFNSQLVSLSPVGIKKKYMFYLKCYFLPLTVVLNCSTNITKSSSSAKYFDISYCCSAQILLNRDRAEGGARRALAPPLLCKKKK